jgi:hypothetical protein
VTVLGVAFPCYGRPNTGRTPIRGCTGVVCHEFFDIVNVPENASSRQQIERRTILGSSFVVLMM